MNTYILPLDTDSEIDEALIPNEIYDLTINKKTKDIQAYFILHPRLLRSFVGFNGALKLADQLSSQKKCGCFYVVPWETYYQVQNNAKMTRLSFSQQVQEYRYMIKFWYPVPSISNMHYLSNIALGMIQSISLYRTYLSNNLEYCTILQEPYYYNNFESQNKFRLYINKYFSN
jgi:hypothetical protein